VSHTLAAIATNATALWSLRSTRFGEDTFLMFQRVSIHCEVRAGADWKTEHRAYNKHRTLRLVKLTRRLCRIKKQAMFEPWSSAWIIWRTLVFLPVLNRHAQLSYRLILRYTVCCCSSVQWLSTFR